jgi:hypothetical protein
MTTLTVRLTTIVAFVLPSTAFAQWGSSVFQADSLLASGRVTAAESMYYAVSSARPRDAVARAALGRYLAARGALYVGATLLEEARMFGGDTVSIARSLVPILGSLGNYRALAVLPGSPLSTAEQSRVRWLVTHAPVLEFPDSTATLPYRPATDGTGLGTLSIGVGERAMDAVIDPSVSGVVLRGRAARKRGGLHVFGEDASGVVAVVSELHLGAVTLTNVPARLDSTTHDKVARQSAYIGLDVLRHLAPTFDPATDTLTLRRSGQVSMNIAGTRTPMLLDTQGLRILLDGRWTTAASRETAQLLVTRRWTLDARHGVVVLQ